MAQIPYRANLSAAIFPMTLARAGRSVIVPQADQNFDRRVDPEGEQKSAGIPQIIYGENILPTADGYQSVGYETGGTFGSTGAVGVFWEALEVDIPTSGYKHVVLLIGIGVVKYTVDGINYTDLPITGTAPVSYLNFISTATVRGVCYLHVGSRIYTVDLSGVVEVTASFTPVGILTNLINICGAFNYLILLKSDGTVNWSSTTTPTDFTPSLVSGAGSGALTGNAGQARYLKRAPKGFYVYCFGNVVSVTYTGNARYPWRFTPVADSEGVLTDKQFSGEASDSFNVMLARSGAIYEVSESGARLAAPEVSELITRVQYKDVFNYSTNEFSISAVPFSAGSILKYLMGRYIILTSDNVGIVYDMQLKRYGKFNVNHTYVVDVENMSANGARTLAFIDLYYGTTKILSQDVNDPAVTFQGVIVLGKFQYARSRFLALDEVSLEASQLASLVSPANLDVYAIPTLDGKTFQPAQALYKVIDSSTGAVMTYNSTAEGKNVSLLIKGAFDLTSVEIHFHLGGGC